MKNRLARRTSPVIVVVEDELECAVSLEVALARTAGFSVRIFSTAEEALAYLHRRQPAALITDIHLPGSSGFDLIGRVRALFSLRLPVIAVSADPDPDTPRRALQAGADAFFPKPYSPQQLCSTLEALIHDG